MGGIRGLLRAVGVGRSNGWLVGWLVGWLWVLEGQMVGWSIGWLVDWLVVGWNTSWLVSLHPPCRIVTQPHSHTHSHACHGVAQLR